MILQQEQATVYRANGRRYLSKRAAYHAIARGKVIARHRAHWAWDREDGESNVELREGNQLLIKRFARLLAYYDRIRGKQ